MHSLSVRKRTPLVNPSCSHIRCVWLLMTTITKSNFLDNNRDGCSSVFQKKFSIFFTEAASSVRDDLPVLRSSVSDIWLIWKFLLHLKIVSSEGNNYHKQPSFHHEFSEHCSPSNAGTLSRWEPQSSPSCRLLIFNASCKEMKGHKEFFSPSCT